MLKFEWNALRPGTQVAVHDDDAADLPMCSGTVALVQKAAGSSDVAIRIMREGSGQAMVRPRRHAVHLLPVDPSDPCWRCDLRATTPDWG